jgi:hypothetical protein
LQSPAGERRTFGHDGRSARYRIGEIEVRNGIGEGRRARRAAGRTDRLAVLAAEADVLVAATDLNSARLAEARALIGLAQNAKGPALAGPLGSSVKVVAGAGFGLCRTSVNLSNVRYQLADFNLCTG